MGNGQGPKITAMTLVTAPTGAFLFPKLWADELSASYGQ